MTPPKCLAMIENFEFGAQRRACISDLTGLSQISCLLRVSSIETKSMADPLSISSGIAGILSLAGLVLSQCYQYGCNVAGAPEEAQKLISEVTSLSGILVGIQAMVARCGVSAFSFKSMLHSARHCSNPSHLVFKVTPLTLEN